MQGSLSPITSVIFFRYSGFAPKWWAFTQMQLAKGRLQAVPGATFVKLMGTGGGLGFSLHPNLSVYALLICWEDDSQYRTFLKSELYLEFKNRSEEQFLAVIKSFRQHGQWDGQELFTQEKGNPGARYVGVITRASIKKNMLPKFWKRVPEVSRRIMEQPGLIFAKGMGEWPFVELATFSVWKNEQQVEDFAYKGKAHGEAVRKTRELNWFKEELFARFELVETAGTWQGKAILPALKR